MYDQYGNKLVRKAIPYQLYDMAGLQQWFEEMSAKGFLLDSFGIRTGIFRVGEPAPEVRYRLEPQTYRHSDGHLPGWGARPRGALPPGASDLLGSVPGLRQK